MDEQPAPTSDPRDSITPDAPNTPSPSAGGRLVFVEDDLLLVRLFQRGLEDAGFQVDPAPTVADARRAVERSGVAAVLLDLELPDESGLTLLHEMRARGDQTPVVVLTGRGGGDDAVIRGLETGADDYVEKPVTIAVLLARLRAVLRRGRASAGSDPANPRAAAVLTIGPLTLDRLGRRATVEGQALDLTPREFALLEHLMLCAGETVTRAELLEQVWEMTGEPESNVVDAHMARLRAKLRALSATPDIRTVRGKGFVLTPA